METNTNYDQGESNGKKTLWIIGGVILVVMIIGIVYGATQKSLKKATDAENTADSVQLNTAGSNTGANGAVLGASEMVETPVELTGLTVVNLQTFPQKVQAQIKGNLADACSTAKTDVNLVGKKFTITVTATKAKDAVCATVITPYEAVVDLPVAGATAGKYTVVLGKMTKTFTLAADNEIQYSSDK